jgi:KNOX2 domain
MSRHKRNSSIFQYFADRVASFGADDSHVPVIVYEPTEPESEDQPEVIEDIPLLSLGEFSFYSILHSVEPEVDAFMVAYTNAMNLYRDNLSEEMSSAALMQSQITEQMAKIDKLAVKTLHNSHNRITKAQAALKNVQGVEDLAQKAESVYESVATIVNMLNDIEALLPPSERLTIANSFHKAHYPNLHKLLKNSRSVRIQRVPRKSVSMSALSPVGKQTGGSKRYQHIDSPIVGRGDLSPRSSSKGYGNNRDEAAFDEQRILLSSRVPEGYPRALLSYRTLSPQPASPRRHSVSSDALPMSESESASTITSVSPSFSLHNTTVNMWSGSVSKNESAQERLKRIMRETR